MELFPSAFSLTPSKHTVIILQSVPASKGGLTLAPTIHSWGPTLSTSPSPPLPPASQAGTNARQTHTPTHTAVTHPHGSAKSHNYDSSIYIVLCVQFYACVTTCTQLLYHTQAHCLRFLTAGGAGAAHRTPGRAASTPEAQAGSKDSYFLEWFLHESATWATNRATEEGGKRPEEGPGPRGKRGCLVPGQAWASGHPDLVGRLEQGSSANAKLIF